MQSYVKKGYIKPVLETGKWRFRDDVEKLMRIVRKRKVVLYARVSNTRKDDLINQVKYLEENVKERPSDNRRGIFIELEEEGVPQLRMILNNEVSKAIAYPDRLVRFGFEILEEMCRAHNYEIVTLREDETPERELVEDLISIVVSFSGKLYAAVMELSLKYRPVIKVKSSNCHKWSRLTGEMSLPGFEI